MRSSLKKYFMSSTRFKNDDAVIEIADVMDDVVDDGIDDVIDIESAQKGAL
ncbi:hypothetical protein AAKU64_001654 [Undibacterium sp. GrIS 1.8]